MSAHAGPEQGGQNPRERLLARVVAAVQADPRVVGLVDYGSSSYGRADEWSDLDLTLFIRDADLDAFDRDWKAWAARFGELLLAYRGKIGHPWTVYEMHDEGPVPLRVDYEFQRESELDALPNWPNSPNSVQAMLLYDGTGGRLASRVQQLVGKSLAPREPAATFERLCGDFWYFLLYVYSKLQRGEAWVARMVFHSEVLDNLIYLLRLEAGATERWQASQAAFEVERTLSPARLAQLERCIPAAGAAGLLRAFSAAAVLGYEVSASIAAQQRWPWPQPLGERVRALLDR